jgi:hypothetical protein
MLCDAEAEWCTCREVKIINIQYLCTRLCNNDPGLGM